MGVRGTIGVEESFVHSGDGQTGKRTDERTNVRITIISPGVALSPSKYAYFHLTDTPERLSYDSKGLWLRLKLKWNIFVLIQYS